MNSYISLTRECPVPKIFIVIALLSIVVLSGCSSRTAEGSCMNACEQVHDCYFTLEDSKDEQEKLVYKECQINCWKSCYSHIINNSN